MASDMETLLVAIVTAESALLVVVTALWLRQRRRADRLARDLEIGATRWWLPGGRAAVKAVVETATRVRDKGVGGAIRSSVEDLLGWAEVERPDLVRLASLDGTLTICFSDIEDSTSLNERLGDRGWLRVLGRHDKIVRRRVDDHGGHIIKSQGDGFMIAFASAHDAVLTAVDIQRALATGDLSVRDAPVRVRIGIHTGRAVHKEGDLYGRNVALAARIAAEADGGEILVSEQVCAALVDDQEIEFGEERDVELKGLAGTHRLHAVVWRE
jgi:adenylate cyclase